MTRWKSETRSYIKNVLYVSGIVYWGIALHDLISFFAGKPLWFNW